MADDHELESKPRGWIWRVAMIIIAFYVLSVGPVVWVFDYEIDPCYGTIDFSYGSTLETVYSPLIWLAKKAPWFGECLETYVLWFCR